MRNPENLRNDLINMFHCASHITTRSVTDAPIFQFALILSIARITGRFHTRFTCRGIYISPSPTLFTAPRCLITFSFRRFYNSPLPNSCNSHCKSRSLHLACEIKRFFRRASRATRDVRIWKTLMKMRDKLLKALGYELSLLYLVFN